MKKQLAIGMLCMALTGAGTAFASHTDGYSNKCYDVNYNVHSDDLKPSCDQQDNKGGKDNKDNKDNDGLCGNKGGDDLKCDAPKIDNKCDDHKICDDNKAGCDTGKDCDKDHGHGDGGCKPPTCPHDPTPPAVPLPASSALGGVGLALVGLMSWLRGRKVIA
jgi:hypothetical protein